MYIFILRLWDAIRESFSININTWKEWKDFTKVSKNVVRYRSKNNFICIIINSYVGRLS